MNTNRRAFLRGMLTAAGAASASRAHAQQHVHPMPMPAPSRPRQTSPGSHAAGFPAGIVPVETPDVPRMPWRLENGVKVFHIVTEHVRTEFLPGRAVDAWGFNGRMPGPTIEVTEGDRVRLVVENRLPEPFSMHWHGIELPLDMDGAPGISQDAIPPGGQYTYEFTLHQHGTFFYHSHMAMQEMMGLIGLFIIHPRQPDQPRVHRDFGLILQEWAILPNNTVPNTLSMEFNWLTINGKAGPATTPMLVKLGERVRIRMVNLGMDHHPIHLHGNTFYVVGSEAGRIPRAAWEPANTVLVGVAQARDVEFDAIYPGDWMLHCHLPHHMMNQMVSMVGPMTHGGSGMHTGMGMPEGMGMVREGHALSEQHGPSLGRAIGLGADFEKPTTNAPLGGAQAGTADAGAQQPAMPLGSAGASAPATKQQTPHTTAEAQGVPGYPQDMFMPMDDMVAKPETYGLRPTWSGAMMGMMTLVRVLKPELYEKIQQLKAEQTKKEAR